LIKGCKGIAGIVSALLIKPSISISLANFLTCLIIQKKQVE